MAFVHLRTHSESLVDGMLRIDDAAGAARADGRVALALTDLNNLFGAVPFSQACRGQGIKPLLGVDVWMEPEGSDKQPSRLLLLVQAMQGYLNLCELLARAWTQNAQRTQAWVKWAWLQELNGGLIALSGADAGAVGMALLAGDEPRAQSLAMRLAGLFGGRFYLELQRAGLPQQETHVRRAVQLAAQLQLPVVATHPVQFLERDDFEAHEARVCIAEGETLANPRRIKRFTAEQYFKTQAEMEALFADLPSALANSVLIAQLQPAVDAGQAAAAQLPIPRAWRWKTTSASCPSTAWSSGCRACTGRGRARAPAPALCRASGLLDATILKMGLPGYFLIVSDFIKWALATAAVGQESAAQRGLAGGLCPLHHRPGPAAIQPAVRALPEPERVSMPDFDIDFCQPPERVIDYVKDKYGRDAVSQIATFGTMAAKAALRDVGRVLGMGYGNVDSIAKLVPAPPGKQVTLQRVPEKPDPGIIYARKEAPELEQREAAEEEVAELLSLAMRVEGLVRNVGMHAGGVLIAPGRITDFCPLYQQPGSASAVSQFAKDDVEIGQFDFLGWRR